MNVEHQVLTGIFYIHKLDHRNSSVVKSQWIISDLAERTCFQQAYDSCRSTTNICWGLHFDNNKVAYLGKSKSSAAEIRNLFIAKFIDSNENSRWHGYPADPFLNRQDLPPEVILQFWLQSRYLHPATIRKLSKGQKCKL